jgi:hypothetical protein
MKKQTYPLYFVSTVYLKHLLFLLVFSLVAVVVAQAQQQDSVKSLPVPEKKSFIGVGLSNTGYYVAGKRKYEVMGGVMPFLTLHYGYRLSKRATFQLGVGYGRNEMSLYGGGTYVSPDSVSSIESHQNIRAIVFPLTLKYTPFNPYKRFQLYGNVSLAPVIGNIKARATENYRNSSTQLYDEEMSSITVIATAGLTLNYRLNNKLSLFADGILFYKNFQFDRPNPNFLDYASAGVGLNYRL